MLTPIVYVISALKEQGPLKVLEGIIYHLPREQYQVHVVELLSPVPEGKRLNQKMTSWGVMLHTLGYSKLQLELSTKKVAQDLQKLLDTMGAKIVHSHGYQSDLVVAQLKEGYTKITTQHNIAPEDYRMYKGRLMGCYMWHRLRRNLVHFHRIIGIMNATSEFYASQLPKSIRVSTIANGVDLDLDVQRNLFANLTREEARKKLKLPVTENQILIAAVGMGTPGKNHKLVLDAVAQLRQMDLQWQSAIVLFLGEGAERKTCEEYAKRLGVPVLFMGHVDGIIPYLVASNVHVSASKSEGFGLTIIEAALAGCPMALSSIPPFIEFAHSLPILQQTLFNPSQAVDCARAIERATTLTYDSKDLARFVRYYSAKRMSEEYHILYQSLL